MMLVTSAGGDLSKLFSWIEQKSRHPIKRESLSLGLGLFHGVRPHFPSMPLHRDTLPSSPLSSARSVWDL